MKTGATAARTQTQSQTLPRPTRLPTDRGAHDLNKGTVERTRKHSIMHSMRTSVNLYTPLSSSSHVCQTGLRTSKHMPNLENGVRAHGYNLL